MPELPEVETMRRGIAAVQGRTIAAVERPPCRKRPIEIGPSLATFRRRAVGQRIAGLDRVGKRVVLVLDSDDRIILEPRMTGLVLVGDPPGTEHLRLRIELEPAAKGRNEPDALLFWDRRGLGSVRVVSPAEFAERYGLDRLGPDALRITIDELAERLGRSRRAVKVALLDQRAVAGIGNLYASEILHLASIHPALGCHRIKFTQWERIHAAVIEVLELAIRHEGSTLSDGTYRNALNQSGSYQNHHRVYDREGDPCHHCGQPIMRIVQAQRATFFCTVCQPRTVRRPAR